MLCSIVRRVRFSLCHLCATCLGHNFVRFRHSQVARRGTGTCRILVSDLLGTVGRKRRSPKRGTRDWEPPGASPASVFKTVWIGAKLITKKTEKYARTRDPDWLLCTGDGEKGWKDTNHKRETTYKMDGDEEGEMVEVKAQGQVLCLAKCASEPWRLAITCLSRYICRVAS